MSGVCCGSKEEQEKQLHGWTEELQKLAQGQTGNQGENGNGARGRQLPTASTMGQDSRASRLVTISESSPLTKDVRLDVNLNTTGCCHFRMLFKCPDLDRDTSLNHTPLFPDVKTTESCVQDETSACHNHTGIKADVDAPGLPHDGRGISCLNLHAGSGVYPGGIIPYPGFHLEAATLQSQRKRVASGNTDTGPRTSQRVRPTLSVVRSGELVERRESFAGVHPEDRFQSAKESWFAQLV